MNISLTFFCLKIKTIKILLLEEIFWVNCFMHCVSNLRITLRITVFRKKYFCRSIFDGVQFLQIFDYCKLGLIYIRVQLGGQVVGIILQLLGFFHLLFFFFCFCLLFSLFLCLFCYQGMAAVVSIALLIFCFLCLRSLIRSYWRIENVVSVMDNYS